ncbi:MAG: pimeloyl-ACP methyl ester carboxylesterase [Parasphingorhabdus sp.]|jgi:pimeloyl-ACP methyl ester carboxylesterase
MQTGYATNGETNITYEVLGETTDPTLIVISGLGSQLVYWTDDLCAEFMHRGFRVIRFDNRDVGLSSKTPGNPPDMKNVMAGKLANPPYTLSDMAADTVAVLDTLNIGSAHVAGVSLGGMIAQTMAIEYPHRISSLTSIMSTSWRKANMKELTGNDDAVSASLTLDLNNPDAWVDLQVEGYREISGPHFDEGYTHDIIERSFQRCYHPAGWPYQMAAAIASGDRRPALKKLNLPTLVIHGGADNLIPPSAGKETADSIPGSRYLYIDDMGHNLLPAHWQPVANAIAQIAGRGI